MATTTVALDCPCCTGTCCCPGTTWPDTLCATLTVSGCDCPPITFTLTKFVSECEPEIDTYGGTGVGWCEDQEFLLAHACDTVAGGDCLQGCHLQVGTTDECGVPGFSYGICVLSCSPLHLRTHYTQPSTPGGQCPCDCDAVDPIGATIVVDIVECP